VGQVLPSELPRFLSKVDVLAYPSRLEGFPNTIVEAMVAGCVPVSWLIDATTDFVIKDGETGFVIDPLGDCSAFADRIALLAKDRERLKTISAAAIEQAGNRFPISRTAQKYAELIKSVLKQPPSWVPRPWSEFRVDPSFDRPWTSCIPEPSKRLIRKTLFHLRLGKRNG